MYKKTLIILICITIILAQNAYAAGLSTTFGRVKVDNLSIGQAYSMQDEANTPFKIKNTSDFELEIKIDVLIPKESELIDGYEPIPDTSWIELEENNFILSQKTEASIDIIIDIPNEEEYRGKKYQVYLWSRTLGGAIAVGLKSKLLISIAE